MKKKDLIEYLDSIFTPLGFKKNRNTWKTENEELVRIVSLEKSKFGDVFYINYGFIIKGLGLDGFKAHVFNGLSSPNDSENQRIIELLDMSYSVTEEYRKKELLGFINKYLLNEYSKVNTISDLKGYLNKKPNLNDIPLAVKRFLNLE